MPMTVVVTRNAPMRYRGFLASCMLEIGAGVYTSPRMNRGGARKSLAGLCRLVHGTRRGCERAHDMARQQRPGWPSDSRARRAREGTLRP